MAKFQSLIQDFPEFIHIPFGRTCNVYKIDRHNSLIKSSIVFVASIRIALRIFYRQERTASHTGVHIALLQFSHLLCGNVIRNHTFCGTFCCQFCQIPVLGFFCDIILIQHIDQFRESRSDPDTLLIFNSLHTLDQYFFNDHRKVISGLSFRDLIQIHEHSHKRCLSVTGHQRDQLILDRLDSALHFLTETTLCHFFDDSFIQ